MLNLILLGEVIQIHFTAPCGKEKFPNCSETYKSPEAYKCKVKYHSNYILFILNMSFFLNGFFFFYVQYYQSMHVADLKSGKFIFIIYTF